MHDVMQVYLAVVGQASPASQPGIVDLILRADVVVQFVLAVLVFMSLTCWAIIFSKYRSLRKAQQASQSFLESFWRSRRLDQVYEEVDSFAGSPVAQVFKAGYVELAKLTHPRQDQSSGNGGIAMGAEDNLVRALRRAATVERTGLEHLMPFLATTGSTAPFIGLFGTVWGILRAFQKIGATGQATVATVGPDIAHALIATAVGLAAAIPAVIAYNYFLSRVKLLNTEMENFSSDFLNIVKRHFRAR